MIHPVFGSNVLPFRRPNRRGVPDAVLTSELGGLLLVYDRLISLLRETYDEGLDSFADGLLQMVVCCRKKMTEGMDNQTAERLLREMRQELRQCPRSLRSLLPGMGARVGENIEYKLGIQFASYA